MAQSTIFTEFTAESAPERARDALRATERQFGFLPSAMARLAASPVAIAAFGRLLAIWDGTHFTPLEREVLAMTMGHEAGCEICLALHSSLLTHTGAPTEVVTALRARAVLLDAKLEAVRAFTLAVFRRKGDVTDSELSAFLAAGFTAEHALEVVVGVATYTLSTFANRLTRADVDAPLEPFALSHDVPAAPAPPGAAAMS